MIYLLCNGIDDRRFMGGWNNVSITTTGVKQIRDTIQFMKKHKITFRRIYSSDILRTKETARLVSNAYGVPIQWDERLRGLDKGLINGLTIKQTKNQFPQYYNKIIPFDMRYPEGESLLDLYKRQKEVLDWLLSIDDALIVTHRRPINMYYYGLIGTEISTDPTKFEVTRASLHELDPKQKIIRKIYDPKRQNERYK